MVVLISTKLVPPEHYCIRKTELIAIPNAVNNDIVVARLYAPEEEPGSLLKSAGFTAAKTSSFLI